MGCVGRNASIQRFAAKVTVSILCPTKSIVEAATTSARTGVHVCMECAAMPRRRHATSTEQ